jgi:hypothetical protein
MASNPEDSSKESGKADEGLDYLDKKKKRKVAWYLLLWFVMPFTAFMKLDELLSDDEEDREYKAEPKNPNTSEPGPQNP